MYVLRMHRVVTLSCKADYRKLGQHHSTDSRTLSGHHHGFIHHPNSHFIKSFHCVLHPPARSIYGLPAVLSIESSPRPDSASLVGIKPANSVLRSFRIFHGKVDLFS